MSADPRYPTGRYQPPEIISDAQCTSWLHDIEALPALVRAAVWGLDDSQLETPYREGGWTLRQVVHHLPDSHLNAYCRFKLALTEDHPTIRPYEEARWAELPEARALPLEPSLVILDGLHARWAATMIAMTPDQFDRTYHHPDSRTDASLRWLLGLYAWHGKHHVAHITSLRTARGW